MITVTIWHNTTVDGQGRHTAMMDGYQPGDPMVAVFTYHADPAEVQRGAVWSATRLNLPGNCPPATS